MSCNPTHHRRSRGRRCHARALHTTLSLLCLLNPARNLLRRQPRRRIVAQLLDQARHRRKDAGLLLVLHQPFDELRVNSLALRRGGNRSERINSLLTRWREGLSGASAQCARDLVNLLGGNPFITTRGAEEKLKVAYNTVVRAIGQLEAAGIVREISEAKRHRVWCAKSLLEILEEPARLEVWEPEAPTAAR